MPGRLAVAVFIVGVSLPAIEAAHAQSVVPVRWTRGGGTSAYRRAIQAQQKEFQREVQAWQKLEAEQAAAAEAEAKKKLEQRQTAADAARKAKEHRREAAKRLFGTSSSAKSATTKSSASKAPDSAAKSKSSSDSGTSRGVKTSAEGAATGAKLPAATTGSLQATAAGTAVVKSPPK